jgi:uncharacterized membrane protein YidH (DUF202 family)
VVVDPRLLQANERTLLADPLPVILSLLVTAFGAVIGGYLLARLR